MNLADYRRNIDELKATVSLRSLIEADGHKVVRAGGLDKCCCPFHRERTPSFVIYDDHGHCFGCSWHGDIFHYVMSNFGCDFKTAVEKLSVGSAKSGHVPIRQVKASKKEEYLDPESLECFVNHCRMQTLVGLVEEFADSLGVSRDSFFCLGVTRSVREGAWVFPMRDHAQRIVGIRLRDNKGRKWALKGSMQGLFIPIGTPQPDLYVTEGPTDCAAMLSMGLFAIGKAAAMQGPEEIVKFIQKNRIRRVIVIADNDSAGLKGAKKLIDVCPVPCCELVLPAKDAREFYRNGGTKELIENLLKSCVWRRPKHAKMERE